MALSRVTRVALRSLLPSRRRAGGSLRVCAYASVVAAALLAYGAHVARAAAAERSLAVGRELDALPALAGSTKTIVLNGQRMMLSSAVVPRSVRAALDDAEQRCVRAPNALLRAVERVPGARAASARLPLVRRLGILRDENERDGVVACLLHEGDEPAPLAALTAEFVRTLDVGRLGDFLYVYARDASAGGTRQAHVIASWTHGSFQPATMFPVSGDAPGSDSPLAARPAGTRRVLSGVSADAAYALRVYESPRPVTRALAEFDADMSARGWTRMADAGAPVATHLYRHASGVTALATAAPGRHAANTVFSLVEMGAPHPSGGRE